MRVSHWTVCFGVCAVAMSVATVVGDEIEFGISDSLGEPTVATSGDIELVSHTAFNRMERELMAVNSELAGLKARLASLEEGGVAQVGYSDASASDCHACCCRDCWCNPCCGVVYESQLLWLRPHDSEPDSVESSEFQTASRHTLGYMNSCGRTWRLRYFEFAHDEFDGDFLHQEMLDLEYAGRFRWGCNWQGEVMGGLRWAQYEDNDNEYTDTIGPMAGIEVRNQCSCNTAVYGLVRQSFQFGTEVTDDELGTFGVSELQLGAEYQRCMCGGRGYFRGMIEAQHWSGVEDNDSEDLGLIGFGIAAGITR